MHVDLSVEEALSLAGAALQKEFGADPIPRRALADAVMRQCACSRSSVLPSDFAYNMVNRAGVSCERPVFIQEGRGYYRFVGRNHPYTGDVFWKPSGGTRRKVGAWNEGVPQWIDDPRT